nr:unnamed protein product [Callosobruchus analis]
MNLTTTETPVLSISEASLLQRQPRFGYIPLLGVFLSNLLSNTAVAKYIPLGAVRLSYDPIPLLRPVSHPIPSHHHYSHDPSPPPPSSEEVQHFYHHHYLPHINQNQIVNILDKKPTEIVVETDTEEPTETSTEHQGYRDDGLEKSGIDGINDKSAKMLFKRGISSSNPVTSKKKYDRHSYHENRRPLETGVENIPTESFFGVPSRIDGLEEPAMKDVSEKSVKILLKRKIDKREDINTGTYDHTSNVGQGFMADPLPLMNQQPTLVYRKPTYERNGKDKEHEASKKDNLENFYKPGFSESTGSVSSIQYEFRRLANVIKSEGNHSQDMSKLIKNDTHVEAKIRSGIKRSVLAKNEASIDIGIQLEGSGVKKLGNAILFSSDVGSLNKTSTGADRRNSDVKQQENGFEKSISEKITGRSMRALVKRGAANRYNRYRVRKNNRYLYQKRRRVPDYYYDSYEDITTSRYYKPRRRPTRPRKPIDSYEDIYDSNEDYYYEYPEVAKPHKNRRRSTTTIRPRRTNPRPTTRRRIQTTISEYDDDYAVEVIPRQGPTTITTGETDQPNYGPSHGHEGVSITYGPPSGGGHGLYGPPSTSYGHPHTHYGPPSTHHGTPSNGFAPSSHGYYQVPFSDWYSNEVSRAAIAKKAQDTIGFENIFN